MSSSNSINNTSSTSERLMA
uniref:Uncharacterized protein n=1 Tax=Arundo donax TaxID=35708 RepID=A0A0A8ZY47_ARUDO